MNMTLLGRAAACMALAAGVAGCATVTRGVRESWTVKTEPPGASVKTSTGNFCDATPCTMKLKRKDDFEVIITKPGYQTAHAKVGHQLAGGGGAAFVGNALIGGVIGAGVDASNGSTMELKPNPLVVTLTPELAAEAPAPQAAPAAGTPTPAATAPATPPATPPRR
jgi:uncharacterized protein YcfJ